MLIRIYNDQIVEFPDDLAAVLLACPLIGSDVPDYSIEEVNAVIHSILGAFFEEEFTLEQNIAAIREIYAPQCPPVAANLKKAFSLIMSYNENIAMDDIAHVGADLVFPCGGNNYKPNHGNVIDQSPNPDADTAAPMDLQGGPVLARVGK